MSAVAGTGNDERPASLRLWNAGGRSSWEFDECWRSGRRSIASTFFPIADRDTGTNLAFTLGAVLQGLREPRFATAGEVVRRAATESDRCRARKLGCDPGVFLQGVAEVLAPGLPPTPDLLARAALGGIVPRPESDDRAP